LRADKHKTTEHFIFADRYILKKRLKFKSFKPRITTLMTALI
jgi:hypothetical protein